MTSKVLRVAFVLAALSVLGVACVYAFQERFVFRPPPLPATLGRGATRVEYTASDGQRLAGYLVEPRCAVDCASGASGVQRGAILFFHGSSDVAGDDWATAWARDAATRTGLPVLLAEFRGFGGLSGRPTYEGEMRDARAALAFVRARYALDATHVVLVGHSLGAAVATKLAREEAVRALALEAPFTTSVAVARYRYGTFIGWAAQFILRSPFAPLEDVPHIDAPISVVMGSRDQTVPPEMSRAVFRAARRKGVFLEIAGAGHHSFIDPASESYWTWFLRSVNTP